MLFISEVPYLFFSHDLDNNNEQYGFDDESHISEADKE